MHKWLKQRTATTVHHYSTSTVVNSSGHVRNAPRCVTSSLFLFCSCKDPLRATLRTRRVAATERLRSCDLLIILRSCLLLSRVLITASCSTTKRPSSLQTQDDLRVPITLLSAFTAPFLLYFLSFPALVLLSRTKHLLTQRCHHEAAVRSFSSHSPFPFMHSCIHHHRHP